MIAMNEPNNVMLKNNVRFVVNWGRGSHSVNSNRSGCNERKSIMTRNYTISATRDQAPAFADQPPQAELDAATLQLEAQLNERKRIAQDLHDTLLQGFTGIALKLDALTNSLPPELSQTKEQLQKLLQQTDEYLADARRCIWQLRSNTLKSTEDFARALLKASERALAGTGIQLNFSVCGAERTIKSISEENLLHICEEALANAAKHARPTKVDVTLEFNSATVRLWVRDDGCGFHPSCLETTENGHLGLLGIQERVAALSGMLSINSSPGGGTSLWVIIPADGTRTRAPGARIANASQ
jgi:signal transduction histidine kinase